MSYLWWNEGQAAVYVCLVACQVTRLEYRWLHQLRVTGANQVKEQWLL